jgi:hypothetical protein
MCIAHNLDWPDQQLKLFMTGEHKPAMFIMLRILCNHVYLKSGEPRNRYDAVVLSKQSRALSLLLKPTLSKRFLDLLRQDVSHSVVLILEDCDRFSLKQLIRISTRLNMVKSVTHTCFGGLNVVFVGALNINAPFVLSESAGADDMTASSLITHDTVMTEKITQYVNLSDLVLTADIPASCEYVRDCVMQIV